MSLYPCTVGFVVDRSPSPPLPTRMAVSVDGGGAAAAPFVPTTLNISELMVIPISLNPQSSTSALSFINNLVKDSPLASMAANSIESRRVDEIVLILVSFDDDGVYEVAALFELLLADLQFLSFVFWYIIIVIII